MNAKFVVSLAKIGRFVSILQQKFDEFIGKIYFHQNMGAFIIMGLIILGFLVGEIRCKWQILIIQKNTRLWLTVYYCQQQ